MKHNVTQYDFRDAFQSMRPNNFSYEALEGLYQYLIELEDDMGTDIELDVIALCCDYIESTFADVALAYDLDANSTPEEILGFLHHATSVIWHDDTTVLYSDF